MRVKPVRFFSHNLGLKLFSLALAMILWYMAVGRERAEVGLTIPLELVNIPKDMVISNQVPDGVGVRVRGSVTLARQIGERKLRFSLDLSGAKLGPNEFLLATDQLALPRGLDVTRLAPSKITVELEELVIKTLSLLPVIKGEPQPGYIIDDISLEPRSVAVKGPQSQLRNLDILWTEPVDVTKLKETVSLKTRPVLPDVSLSLVDPVEVRAQLGIVEKTIIREFTGVPIETQPGGDPRPQVRLDPTSVTLVVKGPVNAMADLAVGSNLTARVNMAGLEPGTHERMIIVNAPPRVEVLKVEPRLARITVLEGEPDGTEPPPEGTLAPLKRPVLPEIPAPGEPAALPGHAAPSDGGPIDKTKGGKVEP